MMQLNMHALAELTYRYGRDMRANGHGRILNISSVASMMAGPYMAMYFASKAFVRCYPRQCPRIARHGRDGGPAVCPGPTRPTRAFQKAANMSGRNFFTMTKPATARQLATYAYRRMMRGSTLATMVRSPRRARSRNGFFPGALTRRIAAFMNGGKPHTLKV